VVATLLDLSNECTYRCTCMRHNRVERSSAPPGGYFRNRECVTRIVKSRVSMNALAITRSLSLATVFGGQAQHLRIFVKEHVLPMREKPFETRALDRLLYSVADAAVLLSCSKNTIYSLIRSGEILAVYPTSKARISAESLMRFVTQKEFEARLERQTQRSITR
jgi:excisionase family DNA binding protein